MANETLKFILLGEDKSASKTLAGVGASADDAGKRVDRAFKGLDKIGSAMTVAGAGILAGVGAVAGAAANFDQAMSSVAATGADARDNMDALRKAALDFGADTAFSANEAAGGIENLLRAGVSAQDVMGGGLAGALDLAAAGELAVADAAEIASTAMVQFKLEGKDVPHIADLLAAGAGKAAGEVSDMAAALKQSGLVASATGLSIEETTGTLAAFASAGLIGSDAGTSFKTMLQRLSNPSKEAAREMKALGIAAYDAQGQFVGMEALAGQLERGLSKLTPAQRDAAMATIFGSDAVRAANVLYSQGSKGIADWTAAVNDQGFAAETASVKTDNLKGDFEELGGAVETAMIKFGSGSQGPLRDFTQGLSGLVAKFSEMPAPAQQSAAQVAAVGGALLLAGGGAGKAIVGIRDVSNAYKDLIPQGGKLDGTLRGVGAAAGVMGAAFALVEVGKLIDDLTRVRVSAGDVLTMLERMRTIDDLDGLFNDATFGVETFDDALRTLASSQQTFVGQIQKGVQELIPLRGNVTAAAEGFQQLDAGLVNMNAEDAAAKFQAIASRARDFNLSVEDLVQYLPQYAAKLQETARANGQSMTATEALTAAAYDLTAAYGDVPGAVSTNVTAPGAELSEGQVLDLSLALRALPGLTQAKVLAPGARPSKAEVDAFTASVGRVPGLTTAQIRTIADLYGVDAAKRAIASVRDKAVTVSVYYKQAGSAPRNAMRPMADGGMLVNSNIGLTQAFASGGFYAGSIGSRSPGLYPYAGPGGVTMNEEGSGPWESIISGHPAKLGRSRMITEETARRLGGVAIFPTQYRDGGIHVPTHGGGRAVGVGADLRAGIQVNVTNFHPQAEPTSVTTNKALQYAAALGMV